MTNTSVRAIKEDELDQLLLLYKHQNPDDPDLNANEIQGLWHEIVIKSC